MEVQTYQPKLIDESEGRRRRIYGLVALFVIAGCVVVGTIAQISTTNQRDPTNHEENSSTLLSAKQLNRLRDELVEKIDQLQDKFILFYAEATSRLNASIAEMASKHNSRVMDLESKISEMASKQKAMIEIVQFGYTHHFNGSFYKIHSIVLEWEKAEGLCQFEGAHLASIHSNEENQFLHKLVKDSVRHYWLGLKYVGQNWIWSDESVTDYLNWYSGQPNSMANGHRYTWIYHDDGKWAALQDANIPFICKKRLPT